MSMNANFHEIFPMDDSQFFRNKGVTRLTETIICFEDFLGLNFSTGSTFKMSIIVPLNFTSKLSSSLRYTYVSAKKTSTYVCSPFSILASATNNWHLVKFLCLDVIAAILIEIRNKNST